MNHIDILKRAFHITWRYRALWIFGFFLTLCGGAGGSRGANFNFPGGGGDFDDFGYVPGVSNIDPGLVIALGVGVFCLIIFLILVSVLVQVITRTALIGMVRQITETETVTIADGWRLGWSRGAWRLFLLGLVIGIPLVIFAVALILLAFSPLLLLITDNRALLAIGIIATILAFLFVLLILIIVGALVSLFLELARRRVVLDDCGVVAGIGDTFGLIKRHLKDIAIVWLLMFGVGFAWAFVALIVVLPVSLIVAFLVGVIPAVLVYLISNSFMGALITGFPLAFLAMMLIFSAAGGLYLIFRSAVWTLAYLEIQQLEKSGEQDVEKSTDSGPAALTPEPQSGT